MPELPLGIFIFILREKSTAIEDNGVWLATIAEHYSSLQDEFPSMCLIQMFGPGPTGWQILPCDSDDFEEAVLRACELVHRGDFRTGKIPKAKISKNSVKKIKKSIRKNSKKKLIKKKP